MENPVEEVIEGECDAPSPSLSDNVVNKEEPKQEVDDDDHLPLSSSKAKKRKGAINPCNEVKKEVDGCDAPIAAPNGNLVKKEPKEEEDDDDDLPLALSKGKKKKAATDSSKVKKEEGEDAQKENVQKKSNSKPLKVKKEEPKDLDDEWEEMDKKKKKIKKKEVEKKVVRKGSKEEPSKRKDKKERKLYDLPGQKHDPPEERDPLRIFYESLYQQVPSSEMASFWMMEWGLLPQHEAKKVYEKKLRKTQQQKLGSPIKAVSIKKISTVSAKMVEKTVSKTLLKTSKKRKASDSEAEDEGDDDFSVSPKKKIKKQKASS